MPREKPNNIEEQTNISEQKLNRTEGSQTISTKDFFFLPDDPVDVDEFGTHECVVESIAQQVETDDSDMTIGLEGTWGSGKTSIILMLRKRWEGRNDIQLFTFDAWSHQGDPLRRSFLEELIRFLGQESIGWISPKDWKEKTEQLTKRTQKAISKCSPEITGWAIAFAITWMLVPLGFAFLRFLNFEQKIYWPLFSILFILAPLILFLSAWARAAWSFKDVKEKSITLAGLFIGKNVTRTKSTATQGIDPTSIEFQNAYLEILRQALPREKKRKLLIVMDNLDRVSAENALNIWATMKTFVEAANNIEIKGLSVIVPYDPTSIKELWDGVKKGMVNSFKEKTFRVRYRVAPPLASRWKEYFEKRLLEAFPSQDEDTHHDIYNIFRIQALPSYGRNMLTPREMKLFINRMVALGHQHFSDISLEEIALYAATELSEPQMLENLVGYQSQNEKFFAEFVRKDWKKGLAAIHFGVSRKDAGEVLYEPAIRLCLSKGKSDELKELIKNPGAENCCEICVQNMTKVMKSKELLTASAAFESYNLQNSSRYIKKSIKYIANRIPALEDKDFKFNGILNEKNARDVIRLMEFQPSICPVVRDKLSIRVTEEEIKEIVNVLDGKIFSWVKATVQIVQYFKSRKGFEPTLRLTMPNSETYLKILRLVANEPNGKEVLKFFCPADRVSEKYLKEYLAKIEGGKIEDSDVHIVLGILGMNCWQPKDIERIALGLETAMKPNLAHDATERVFRILYEQQEEDLFEGKLRRIAENGRAFELLQQHHGQPSCAAFCLSTIFMYHPAPKFEAGHLATNGQQKYNELLKNPDENINQNIAKYCIEFDWIKKISQSVQDTNSATSDCMAVILRKLVNQDNNNEYLNADRFISCHSLIESNLNRKVGEEANPYEVLVGQLLKKTEGNLLSALQSRQTNVEFGHAYHIALKEEDLDTKSLEDKLCQEIKISLNKEQWLEQLRNEGWILNVVIELVNQEYNPNLDNKFVDALIEHARLLLDGKAKVEYLEKAWPKLLNALSDTERDLFRRQLPDILSDTQKPILPLINLYKDELETAIQKADKTIKRRFVSHGCMQIANRKDRDELKWMIMMFRNDKSLIKSGDKTEKEGLRNRLHEFLKQEYKQLKSSGVEDTEASERENIDGEWLSAIEDVAEQLGLKSSLETKEEGTNKEDSKSAEEKKDE